MASEVRRRTFLWLVAGSGAALGLGGLGGCRATRGTAAPESAVARFLRPDERRALDALAEALIPEDETVGARGANAVEYVDRFLAAFDGPRPDLFRGGPYSDRNPFPDPQSGEPTRHFPGNAFLEVIPPTRLQTLAFRALLDGPSAVPEVPVAALLLPAQGLRGLYREGLAQLERSARARGAPDFASLHADARLEAFDAAPQAFREAVLAHLAEGMFCAPEYGGNRGGVAWRDYHWGGDSQPLGYTLFDRREQKLRDRPDKPNQSLDPRLPNAGFEPEIAALLEQMVRAAGGRRYF